VFVGGDPANHFDVEFGVGEIPFGVAVDKKERLGYVVTNKTTVKFQTSTIWSFSTVAAVGPAAPREPTRVSRWKRVAESRGLDLSSQYFYVALGEAATGHLVGRVERQGSTITTVVQATTAGVGLGAYGVALDMAKPSRKMIHVSVGGQSGVFTVLSPKFGGPPSSVAVGGSVPPTVVTSAPVAGISLSKQRGWVVWAQEGDETTAGIYWSKIARPDSASAAKRILATPRPRAAVIHDSKHAPRGPRGPELPRRPAPWTS
jgi:hypothetical protein